MTLNVTVGSSLREETILGTTGSDKPRVWFPFGNHSPYLTAPKCGTYTVRICYHSRQGITLTNQLTNCMELSTTRQATRC
jgi:hypothetical protein